MERAEPTLLLELACAGVVLVIFGTVAGGSVGWMCFGSYAAYKWYVKTRKGSGEDDKFVDPGAVSQPDDAEFVNPDTGRQTEFCFHWSTNYVMVHGVSFIVLAVLFLWLAKRISNGYAAQQQSIVVTSVFEGCTSAAFLLFMLLNVVGKENSGNQFLDHCWRESMLGAKLLLCSSQFLHCCVAVGVREASKKCSDNLVLILFTFLLNNMRFKSPTVACLGFNTTIEMVLGALKTKACDQQLSIGAMAMIIKVQTFMKCLSGAEAVYSLILVIPVSVEEQPSFQEGLILAATFLFVAWTRAMEVIAGPKFELAGLPAVALPGAAPAQAAQPVPPAVPAPGGG